jgi:hypothetical protein
MAFVKVVDRSACEEEEVEEVEEEEEEEKDSEFA